MVHNNNIKTAAVLGAGVAGLASAIRLAALGVKVTVYEQSPTYGGKMGEWSLDGFRWDTGPSLFTMPQFVKELLTIDDMEDVSFDYDELETICQYFWDDGTRLTATKDMDQLLEAFEENLNEPKNNIKEFLADSQCKYEITNHVFLEKSLHKLKTYLNWDTLKSMLKLHRVQIFSTMHHQNSKRFNNPKTVQFFNRYATYNGSNPYEAPATLNVIPYYEFGMGAFFPKRGIRSIADSLHQKAVNLGVEFHYNHQVKKLDKIGGKYQVDSTHCYDISVCNMDVASAAKTPLRKLMRQKAYEYEPSSSALIFYWGMDKEFIELDVHNIFFSSDYQKEFTSIFKDQLIDDDPTVYVHISSKISVEDAPPGGENWFVMVNAPYVENQDWDSIIEKARLAIIQKLSKVLGQDITKNIQVEHKLTPQLIMNKTGSYKGALYGASSNNRMAAFLRQPNFSSEHKGLYFCGGSVHPGGGIPLCLLSAKITTDIISRDYQLR